mgnify:FL=1
MPVHVCGVAKRYPVVIEGLPRSPAMHGSCFLYMFRRCHFYKGDAYIHLLFCDAFCAVSVGATISITLEIFLASNLSTIIQNATYPSSNRVS